MAKLRSDAITWQLVDDEVVCLDLASSQYLSINASGAVLWPQLVDGSEPADLVQTLTDAFGIDRRQAAADVEAFLAMLSERDLLAPG